MKFIKMDIQCISTVEGALYRVEFNEKNTACL